MGRRRTKEKEIEKKSFKTFFITILILIGIVSGVLTPIVEHDLVALSGNGKITESSVLAYALGHNATTKENLSTFTFLLIGESAENKKAKNPSWLADSIMLCSYSPNAGTFSMLSIPRDTFAGTNTRSASGQDKINTAYVNGTKIGQLLSAVKRITGVDVYYYARVDTDSLIKLVDLVGGVDFNVPINMKYDDSHQNLHINLRAGLQRIDGKKAEQLLRFRHNNDGSTYPNNYVEGGYGGEDFGRMKTQRDFISTIIPKVLQGANPTKLQELANIADDSIKTNIEWNNYKDYLPYVLDFNSANIKSERLPGESDTLNGLSFFLHDAKETQTLISEMFE